MHVFAVAPFLLATMLHVVRYNVPRMCFVNKMDREAWMRCETWYEVVTHAMLPFFLELFWTSRMNISIKWTLNMMECLLLGYSFRLGCHSALLEHADKVSVPSGSRLEICLWKWLIRLEFGNNVCLNFQGCWCMSILLVFLIQQTYEHKYSGDMCLCRIYMQTIYVQRSFQFWTANLIAKLCSSCGNACPFFQSTCCLTSHPAVSLVVRVQTSSRMCKWWWISWERTQCLGWMLSPWHIKHKLVFLRPIWMIQNGWSTSYDLERLHVVTSEPHTKFITRTGEGLIPTVPYLKCLTFPHSPTLHREVFPLFPLDFSHKKSPVQLRCRFSCRLVKQLPSRASLIW